MQSILPFITSFVSVHAVRRGVLDLAFFGVGFQMLFLRLPHVSHIGRWHSRQTLCNWRFASRSYASGASSFLRRPRHSRLLAHSPLLYASSSFSGFRGHVLVDIWPHATQAEYWHARQLSWSWQSVPLSNASLGKFLLQALQDRVFSEGVFLH